MSIFSTYIDRIYSVSPNLKYKKPNDSQEFFGYLLISQIETIESLTQLESKFGSVNNKADYLEKTVEILKEKCNFLEENICELKNIILELKNKSEKSQENTVVRLATESMNPGMTVNHDLDDSRETECLLNQQILSDITNFANQTSCNFCSINQSSEIDSKYNPDVIKLEANILEQDHKEIQRLFNKRVKYEVNKKFGPKYLAHHQVRELDVKEMYKIKKKVVRLFSPFPLTIKDAWNNAMNSLRQDRHQLKKRSLN